MTVHYFITSQIDTYTSAIEIAEIQRLKLFDDLDQPAAIVTRNYVRDAAQVWNQLGISGRVINLFQYFQGSPDGPMPTTQAVLKQATDVPIENNVGVVDGKTRVKVSTYGDELYYIDYLDKWGFTDRRDFYDQNRLAYSEYFDDSSRLNSRIYYTQSGEPVLTFRYHGGPDNQAILSLIMLYHQHQHLQFDDMDQLMAYFLDCLAQADPDPRFYSDREDVAVVPFQLMKQPAKRYIILHSTFTTNAKRDGEFYPYVKKIAHMTDKLTGIISSTTAEAEDVHARIPGTQSYTVPVSYIPNRQFAKAFSTANRTPGQIIAVARVTKLKQLDHIINIAIMLHQKLPEVDLKIYGYEDSTSDAKTVNHLHQMIKDQQADDYIHFCGYVQDLTEVYEDADVLALTSQFEGFSMAILEALSHGCPVVSYDINYGPGEMVESGVNGELVAADDIRSMYEKLLALLTNEDLLKTYSWQSMIPLNQFSEDSVKADWLKVIEGV
ncbi:glycosyltransferase [Lentilactobacillus parabuchneri]|jgi:poly(glycerol-phosphate) alpha-glucosyltransferase|uniref:Glycosyltransferase, group 1 family protein n=2 Tax=Lentilactobacillus parabuchneri TaxID=152331 RepID=A0A0R1YSS4_9LACO|nr:glycosyltransferase, group 1 family protein [Lentilactobacillus parabuchneri DSM 5707 = NBRC 107865]MCT2885052.1 glycosyltransferase [Lentilactobacillus parabuchneri]OBU98389.1 hypothetical protein A7B51_11515 [Lentilactobacillus parabuchneri]OCB80447.1 hypothetical protein A8O18_06105 [Lentilactobacillus parabuchneri]OCB83814.1 hypothetical protein A7322_09400 [Lentilactobacillus parabuchneri]